MFFLPLKWPFYGILTAIKTRCKPCIKSATPSGKLGDAGKATNQWRRPLIDKVIVHEKTKTQKSRKALNFCEDNHTNDMERGKSLFTSFFVSRGSELRP